MLRALHIENVAVIRRADLDLESGFSVLTGETGAGKSMIIDSINLLLGNRTTREIIRTGETTATVGALFEDLSPTVCHSIEDMGFSIEDGSLLLQRTITADGKSKTRLNGQALTLAVQKEIARMLISIHGQSDSQRLLQKSAHLGLVDAYAHIGEEHRAYARAYAEWRAVCRRIDELSQDASEALRLSEMLKFQIADIDALKLKEGEEERLIKERDRLANLEQIDRQSSLIQRALRGGEKSGALQLILRAESALRALNGLVDGTEELAERLANTASEIEDVAELASGFADEDREDPTARIDRIEGRLEAIARLKRKYGNGVAEILAFREDAARRLEALECSDELREELEAKERELKREAQSLASVLTARRREAAGEITEQVSDALRFLDMPRVQFEIRIAPASLGENGADDAEFLIATNIGEPLLPMLKIASGGELSRIMLALRSVLNDRDGADTVIFDEIDTGISGKTARKVGMKLKETAKGTQVLCVTHSAQIASLADTHYRITKTEKDGRAQTQVAVLDEQERVEEIARILGGIEITDLQRDAARQMIEEYRV